MYPQYLRDAGYYASNNCKEDYNLKAGKSLRLRYRVLVKQGAADKELLEREWKALP